MFTNYQIKITTENEALTLIRGCFFMCVCMLMGSLEKRMNKIEQVFADIS
jgi:hypothetical protein